MTFTAPHSLRALIPFAALVLLSAPLIASAETVLRVGDSVTVAADQTVEEDFYAAGGTVAISGQIVGDMYAVGGSVTTNGSIAQDLSVAGGSVQVHAPVEDDVRVVGGDITIAESVGGDVFVLGGSLTVLSSASIEGDVFFYGGEAEINGNVAGSVMGAAERFRIDSTVEGNVDVSSSRALVLGERASVRGDVRYESHGEVVRAQNAVVEGEVVRNQPTERSTGGGFGTIITVFIMHLFAVLAIYLLFRRELEQLASNTVAHVSRNAVLGLATVFVAPVVVILLMVTVLGLLLGLLGLFTLLAFFFLAYILTAVVVGGAIARFTTNQTQINLLWLLAGVAAIDIALLIPYIGPLLVLAAFVVTLGELMWRGYRWVR